MIIRIQNTVIEITEVCYSKGKIIYKTTFENELKVEYPPHIAEKILDELFTTGKVDLRKYQ